MKFLHFHCFLEFFWVTVLYSLASCSLSKFVFPIPLQCSKPRFVGSCVIVAIFFLPFCFSRRLEIPKWEAPIVYLALMKTFSDRILHIWWLFLNYFYSEIVASPLPHPSHCNGCKEGGWKLLIMMLRICFATIFLFPEPILGWCGENGD